MPEIHFKKNTKLNKYLCLKVLALTYIGFSLVSTFYCLMSRPDEKFASDFHQFCILLFRYHICAEFCENFKLLTYWNNGNGWKATKNSTKPTDYNENQRKLMNN